MYATKLLWLAMCSCLAFSDAYYLTPLEEVVVWVSATDSSALDARPSLGAAGRKTSSGPIAQSNESSLSRSSSSGRSHTELYVTVPCPQNSATSMQTDTINPITSSLTSSISPLLQTICSNQIIGTLTNCGSSVRACPGALSKPSVSSVLTDSSPTSNARVISRSETVATSMKSSPKDASTSTPAFKPWSAPWTARSNSTSPAFGTSRLSPELATSRIRSIPTPPNTGTLSMSCSNTFTRKTSPTSKPGTSDSTWYTQKTSPTSKPGTLNAIWVTQNGSSTSKPGALVMYGKPSTLQQNLSSDIPSTTSSNTTLISPSRSMTSGLDDSIALNAYSASPSESSSEIIIITSPSKNRTSPSSLSATASPNNCFLSRRNKYISRDIHTLPTFTGATISTSIRTSEPIPTSLELSVSSEPIVPVNATSSHSASAKGSSAPTWSASVSSSLLNNRALTAPSETSRSVAATLNAANLRINRSPTASTGSLPTSFASSNKTSSLPPCGPISTLPTTTRSQTSWTAGACSVTTFKNPTAMLSCASTTIAPRQVTACACPDKQIYQQMKGGSLPCNHYTSNDASKSSEALLTCTPAPTCIRTSTPAPPVSSAPPNGGRFDLSIAYPSICNATTVQYSTSRPMSTGSILIDPAMDWGDGSIWRFAAGDGVTIDNLDGTGNPDTGAAFGGQPRIVDDGFTKHDDGSWTMKVPANAPTRPLVAITSGHTTNDSFAMTISSTIPCDKPVALPCNVSNHELTPQQWKAYNTDDFLQKALHEFSDTKGPNFWTWFVQKYIGDGFATSCTVDGDQDRCGPLTQSCADIVPGPYSRQAYMVMASMLSLSHYLRLVYKAYGQSDTDLGDELPLWTTKFVVPRKIQSWQNVVALAASNFGIIAVIGFLLGPLAPILWGVVAAAGVAIEVASATVFGMSSVMNMVINSANFNGASIAAEIVFDGFAQAHKAMKAYIDASKQTLVSTHNQIFLQGINLTDILKGGVFVGDSLINSVTDNDISGPVTQGANWFDRIMIWGLINASWKADDNYIVFLPYGPITWYGGHIVDFTKEKCESQFTHNRHWNSTIYGSCDGGTPEHPGLATFMAKQKRKDFKKYQKKAYYEVKDYTYQGFSFSADDVLKSSVAGYWEHGFDYNATNTDIGTELDKGNTDPLEKLSKLTPASAGVYNLPVCVIYDTSSVPACTMTHRGRKGRPCSPYPEDCLKSNWTGPAGQVSMFKDFISKELAEYLGEAKTLGMDPMVGGAASVGGIK